MSYPAEAAALRQHGDRPRATRQIGAGGRDGVEIATDPSPRWGGALDLGDDSRAFRDRPEEILRGSAHRSGPKKVPDRHARLPFGKLLADVRQDAIEVGQRASLFPRMARNPRSRSIAAPESIERVAVRTPSRRSSAAPPATAAKAAFTSTA